MNSTETKADALKNEPIIIRKIKRDYDRIQVLADEKVQIAEQALKLVSEGMVHIRDPRWV
jgi:DeoR/GlpR family transcriptional regulator of sugar metabolism